MTESVPQIIGSHAERWRHCAGQPEITLLRLAILRDVVRAIHAEKSRYLASGRRDEVQQLKGQEDRLQELRGLGRLEGELLDLMKGSGPPARKRTRLVPQALYSAVEREKLDRYDRDWEHEIAAEAASVGWRFWALETWVEISQIEDWNARLGEQLWPAGLILFVESGAKPGAVNPASDDSPVWLGRWVLILHPRFSNPSDLGLRLESWPGTPSMAPSPARWKLLFSPKAYEAILSG